MSNAHNINYNHSQKSKNSNTYTSITQYLSRPVIASKRKLLDRQVLRMIVKEYYPFSIVEDREFIKLVNMLNPGYTLPSRKTLSKSLLPILYNEIYDYVKNDIKKNAMYVSITTDSWTSVKNENYIAVTAHYIDEECDLKSYLLSCFKYSESHTSINLKNELLRVVQEWGLENRITACTTDNAPNITNAIQLCNWRHVGCFAHSLNLTVQAALKEISGTRERVRSIVGHFKRSPQAANKLKTFQEQLGLTPALVLIQEVITRWNSTYEMFQRILDLKIPLISTLAEINFEVVLTGEDWQIISRSCEILKRFKEITVEISAEKTVSISKSVVFSRALKKFCDDLSLKQYESEHLMKMVSVLKNQVEQRFATLEKIKIFSEATILDPRYKKYGFLSSTYFSEGKKTLINQAKAIHIENQTSQNIQLIDQSITDSESIWSDFDSEVKNLIQSTNPTAAATVEVDKYLQEGLLARSENPLKWWKENKNVYLRLFSIMRKRLGIMATSVPCERIFSKSGQTITEKRNRLCSGKFEKMIFLNFNLK